MCNATRWVGNSKVTSSTRSLFAIPWFVFGAMVLSRYRMDGDGLPYTFTVRPTYYRYTTCAVAELG